MDNGTWELGQLPPNKKAIECKWLFKAKVDEKGAVMRHKAQIVAQVFTQKYGGDYDVVFALDFADHRQPEESFYQARRRRNDVSER